MDIEKIITLWLAIYGALLSTFLGIRELTKERRRILIFLQYSEFGDIYSIIITNVGHRPITIIGVSMEIPPETVPANAMSEVHNQLPVTLTDGQHVAFTLSHGLSGEIYQAKEKIKIIVYDTENRKYSKFKRTSHNEKFGARGPRKMK